MFLKSLRENLKFSGVDKIKNDKENLQTLSTVKKKTPPPGTSDKRYFLMSFEPGYPEGNRIAGKYNSSPAQYSAHIMRVPDYATVALNS